MKANKEQKITMLLEQLVQELMDRQADSLDSIPSAVVITPYEQLQITNGFFLEQLAEIKAELQEQREELQKIKAELAERGIQA